MNNYDFGNYLCELRTRKNLSQTELAKILGVTNKAVSKWENGAAYPSAKLMYPLAKALGVSIEELYVAIGSDKKPKNFLRKMLDAVFRFKKLSFILPLCLAALMYVLFLIFGDFHGKIALVIMTPLICGFVFGGVFLVFYIQVKNPICPPLFLDVFETMALVSFSLCSISLLVSFFENLKTGFTFSLPVCFVALSVVSLIHNKRL